MKNYELSPTLEDYLEAIFQISRKHKVARSMEIADFLNVKRSSVTIALRSLADKGLINYQVRSYVTLTNDGLKIAQCVDKRHHILHDLFTRVLGLADSVANAAACRMEHGMTSDVCRKMTALLKTLKTDPQTEHTVLSGIENNAKTINCSEHCEYHPETKIQNDENQTVNELENGECGIVQKISGKSTLKTRLQEMGIIKGQKITVVKAAPFDDPIEVSVCNAHMSLRREEAALIQVKRETASVGNKL
ncbi:MAG TPA: metal-dependent transcriptional regulator [Chitinispirillaceae bacterium]|nr:metal-dependent transcriptional regulator [Chitinispirillaceae bacterium]